MKQITWIIFGWMVLVTSASSDTQSSNVLKAGTVFKDCANCPEMVVVPGGSFTMGSPTNEVGRPGKDSAWWYNSESPTYQVTIRTFAIGKFEVTKEEFEEFAKTMPAIGGLRNPYRYKQEDHHPVVMVSWREAKWYVEWLSRKTGKQYRLLSEAEWEYAGRAGTITSRYWGNNPDNACEYENVFDLTGKADIPWMNTVEPHNCKDGFVYTAPVGSFKPNPYGIYDMLGNVSEILDDCVHGNYNNAPTDGSVWNDGSKGPQLNGSDTVSTAFEKVRSSENCAMRIVRGGNWLYKSAGVRSASRSGIAVDDHSETIGFRVARTLQ